MSDSSIDLPDVETPPAITSEQAITLFAKNADQLEQLARNLDKAVEHLSEQNKQDVRGYKVENKGYDYVLTHNSQPVPHIDNLRSGGYSSLSDQATKLANYELQELSKDITGIGVLTHEVQLDKRNLDGNERHLFQVIENKLLEAKAVFDKAVKTNSANDENRDDIIQFKRESKFIDNLIEQRIGDAGKVVVEHNKQLVDRQSDLLTPEDIADDKATKFARGVELLTASEQQATKLNPSFRERIGQRKSLDVIEVGENPPVPGR